MQILAYLISTVSFISSIGASMIKGSTKKQMGFILTLTFCSNFFAGVGYIASGTGMNGALSCGLGALISVVNFFYGQKNIPIPKFLLGIYFVGFFVVNIISKSTIVLTTVAILATFSFVIGLAKRDGKGFRFWKILNNGLWLVYDLIAQSYNSFLLHSATMVFTLASSFFYDREKKVK